MVPDSVTKLPAAIASAVLFKSATSAVISSDSRICTPHAQFLKWMFTLAAARIRILRFEVETPSQDASGFARCSAQAPKKDFALRITSLIGKLQKFSRVLAAASVPACSAAWPNSPANSACNPPAAGKSVSQPCRASRWKIITHPACQHCSQSGSSVPPPRPGTDRRRPRASEPAAPARHWFLNSLTPYAGCSVDETPITGLDNWPLRPEFP